MLLNCIHLYTKIKIKKKDAMQFLQFFLSKRNSNVAEYYFITL